VGFSSGLSQINQLLGGRQEEDDPRKDFQLALQAHQSGLTPEALAGVSPRAAQILSQFPAAESALPLSIQTEQGAPGPLAGLVAEAGQSQDPALQQAASLGVQDIQQTLPPRQRAAALNRLGSLAGAERAESARGFREAGQEALLPGTEGERATAQLLGAGLISQTQANRDAAKRRVRSTEPRGQEGFFIETSDGTIVGMGAAGVAGAKGSQENKLLDNYTILLEAESSLTDLMDIVGNDPTLTGVAGAGRGIFSTISDQFDDLSPESQEKIRDFTGSQLVNVLDDPDVWENTPEVLDKARQISNDPEKFGRLNALEFAATMAVAQASRKGTRVTEAGLRTARNLVSRSIGKGSNEFLATLQQVLDTQRQRRAALEARIQANPRLTKITPAMRDAILGSPHVNVRTGEVIEPVRRGPPVGRPPVTTRVERGTPKMRINARGELEAVGN
jgi:hypothetical protein